MMNNTYLSGFSELVKNYVRQVKIKDYLPGMVTYACHILLCFAANILTGETLSRVKEPLRAESGT